MDAKGSLTRRMGIRQSYDRANRLPWATAVPHRKGSWAVGSDAQAAVGIKPVVRLVFGLDRQFEALNVYFEPLHAPQLESRIG